MKSQTREAETQKKKLGETKIQLQAKEKEFADLKSFYEENNASNLNEEERLKMELTETNAKMEEMTRKVDDAENETETVKGELRAKREEFDDLKQLFDDTAANATRGEIGLKEEIVALREQTNALKEELTTAAQTSEEKSEDVGKRVGKRSEHAHEFRNRGRGVTTRERAVD